jgi:tetratricopeptide (TPR) repeat protein
MRTLAFLAAGLLLSTAAVAPAQTGDLGQVSFANSGAAAAQAPFHRGLALMHNFQFPAAAEAFREAQKADPAFVMAYWGEALTHNHAIWMEQDAAKGREALARLGATRAERLAKAATEREGALLDAAETLYGEGDKKARDFAYSAAMERLHRTYPDDVDIASLYALSLLGLAHEGRDFGLYMRSAGVLEQYFPKHPRHPGVVHYLIHSYDDPTHAPLGVRTARVYGTIAPDSHHAQHMTSHIFMALGDWPSTIKANEEAIAISNRDRAALGRPRVMCGHYPDWLAYGYLQAGRTDEGKRIRQECWDTAAGKVVQDQAEDRFGAVESYAAMLLREWIEVGRDAGNAAPALPEGMYPSAAIMLAYGDLLMARGDRVATAAAHARMNANAPAVAKGAADYPMLTTILEVLLLQAKGLEDIRSGRGEQGLASLRRAAEMESGMRPEFGPPVIAKPSFELLGEELLAAGKRDEAAAAFAQALKLAPGRRISLAHAATLGTAVAAGELTKVASSHTH